MSGVQNYKQLRKAWQNDPYAMIEFTPGCPGAGHAQFSPVV
jgi:hypothetical protein